MPNPYAARTSRRTAPEQDTELALVLVRLERLGATGEELAAVADTWDVFDGDWTPAARAKLVRLPDDELRAELLTTRDEYLHDTTTDAEVVSQGVDSYAATTARQATDVVGRPVSSVLTWVGRDAIRALAILDLELGPEGAQRKTLVTPLREMVEP